MSSRLVVAIIVAGLAFAADRLWQIGPILFTPGPPGAFDSVAVKDPSILRYNGLWHLFYTARDKDNYALGYAAATQLKGLASAPRRPLTRLHAAKSKYAAAPQIFYFRPHRKWYLIFQTTDSNYLPVYSTTTDIADPESWSDPKPLVDKTEKAKWIDFWVICDETHAWLFFTRNQQEVVVMSTRTGDFPAGFNSPRVAFAPVHEAVHVYRMEGKPEYVMLYEKQEPGDLRHFGLATSTRLDSGWAVSEERFADAAHLAPAPQRWTDEVSHGELLRSGFDERLEIPRDRWEFLIQGMERNDHKGPYPLLPWKLGLIRLSR